MLATVQISIPAILHTNCQKDARRQHWLQRLPEAIKELQQRWALNLAQPFDSPEVSCAWVAPAVRADGTPAVLKVGMPHMEGAQEITGLRFWNSEPTVRLLESDEALGAMLLERCNPGSHLRALPESEQDVVIADLLRRLWRSPSTPSFRPLSDLMCYWSECTEKDSDLWPEPDLVRTGLDLFKELSRPDPGGVLLATDFHAGNVLRAERHPWLVIDPKPFVGDPAYDATQHLFNCAERLYENPHALIGRLSALLGVSPERVKLWTFARAAAEPRDDWKEGVRFELARALAP